MYKSNAVTHDSETGAVVYNASATLSKNVDLAPDQLCPYNVPRKNEETGQWTKCDMCIDRIQQGLKPACVTACPTGTMNFGDRDAMLEMARKRLEEVKKTHPGAFLADPEDVRVIYLCQSDADDYAAHVVAQAGHKQAILAQARPAAQTRRQFLTGQFRFGNRQG
jgi:formate dehydrogenase iron-sulfur subunit